MSKKGSTWNESTTYRDPVTRRLVRKVTSNGVFNYQPAYHTNTGWTADGKRFVFHSGRGGQSTIFCCDAATGDITQLLDWQSGWAVGIISGADRNFDHGISAICLDKDSGWVYYSQNKSLKAVNIDTLEERTLVEDSGPVAYGMPTVSADGAYVAIPANIIPPEFDAMDWSQPYEAPKVLEIYSKHANSIMQLVRVNTQGTPVPEVVYEEMDCRGNHLQYSPTDPNILHTDRDFAPRFWGGSDGVRDRVWLYHIDEQRLVDQPSPSGRTFQVHSTWTFDGQEVIYHCPGGINEAGPGYVIGVNDLEGNNIVEYGDDSWSYYGHVSAVAGRKAIMLDGNITNDMILWLYYDNPDHPQVEAICKHGTDWNGSEWQYPHPHPQCAPTGDRIVYNAAGRGRSDVFVVEI